MPSFAILRTFNVMSPSLVVRNFATKTKHRKRRNLPVQQVVDKRQIQQSFLAKIRRRAPIYFFSFAAFIALNEFSAYVHYDDDYFYYFYPFPFAVDVGDGPSMLPTMMLGSSLYFRDCWSHRLVWLNLEHLKSCLSGLVINQSATHNVPFKRPWQKGDVVTVYNPFTKYMVSKRIVGVGGDTIKVFGEHAHDYHAAMENGDNNHTQVQNDCGVPLDEQFPSPFCQKKSSERELAMNDDSNNHPLKQEHCETKMVVPPNHVWIEGDNPLNSIDSRHYGPVPESALRGRLTLRIWPVAHEEGAAMLDSKRPDPYMNDEWLEGYGLEMDGMGKIRKISSTTSS